MKTIDELLYDSTNKLFHYLLEDGLNFYIDEPTQQGLYRAKISLERMLLYFEKREEYEKCAFLKSSLKKLDQIKINCNNK
jgi:hypothetical protein